MTDQPDNISERPALSAIFNRAAEAAVRDFPGLAGRFMIVDLEAGEIHGLPDLAKTGFSSVEALEAHINDAAGAALENGTSTAHHDKSHGGLSIIFYNSANEGDAAAGALGVVDHELGHLVVNGALETEGPDGEIYAETAADLFSALRQMQRGGNHPAGIRTLAFTRAYDLINRGNADAQAHFTSFALLELADMAKTTDLSKLEPMLAAGMAEMLARQYAVTAKESASLAKSFEGYAETSASLGLDAALKTVAAKALDAEAPEAQRKLAKFFLGFHLEGKILVQGAPVQLQGAFWDDVRERLDRDAPKAPAGLILLAPRASFGAGPRP